MTVNCGKTTQGIELIFAVRLTYAKATMYYSGMGVPPKMGILVQ